MSTLTKPPIPYIFDHEPMPIFPFIKSEPKEQEPEQQSYFFSHIKYEAEEQERTPLIHAKIEPEEIAVKIEPEVKLENHVQEDHFNLSTNEDAFFLHDFKSESGTTIFKCKECQQTFKSDAKFMRHARRNHHYWLCLVCYQVFPNVYIRNRHMKQNHTKDFSCSLCSKKSYDKDEIRRHFSKHRRRNISTANLRALEIVMKGEHVKKENGRYNRTK